MIHSTARAAVRDERFEDPCATASRRRASGRIASAIACLAALLIVASAALPGGTDRRLLLVTGGDASTARDTFTNEEIASVVPGRDAAVTPLVRRSNWFTLLGDQNRNGRFDDVFSQIDAIEAADPNVVDPSVFDLVLSISSDRVFLDGTRVADGDAFTLLPGGGARIVIPESQFQYWAGTSDDVDLDALAFLADGSVAFSFDEPVVTGDPAITARNGGAVVDDDAIFVHRPGRSRADLLRSGSEIVAIVNRVLGTDYRYVLDVRGLAEDPEHPGDLFFSTGLFSGPGASVIFTTAGGGAVASLNGVALGAGAFGFVSAEDLADFTVVGTAMSGPSESLRSETSEPSASRDGALRLDLTGLPGERVRLLVARGSTSLPLPQRLAGFGDAGYLFLDSADPLFSRMAASPRLAYTLDGDGKLEVALPIRADAPFGTVLLFQAKSESRSEASYSIVVRLVP
jgi:hypothetical protein